MFTVALQGRALRAFSEAAAALSALSAPRLLFFLQLEYMFVLMDILHHYF